MKKSSKKNIRDAVDIDEMQFGFMPGKRIIDAIFIARQIHERYLEKKKDLYFTFVELEKAFDRVPRQVVKWAMRKVGLEEWIINVVYKNSKSAVYIKGLCSRVCAIKRVQNWSVLGATVR